MSSGLRKKGEQIGRRRIEVPRVDVLGRREDGFACFAFALQEALQL